jgi:DNA (cytosine-5)-methyltransferase 3A
MKKKLIVFSMFDGIGACLRTLLNLGYEIDTYYACEIDEKAIAVLRKNYPNINIVYLGNILDWKTWNIDFNKIDLVTGGPPCQPFSIAGKGKGLVDQRGQLFLVFIKIFYEIKRVNPDFLFLIENVKMKQDLTDYFSDLIGVKPLLINSSLVSAQNRLRNYWTNIPNVVMPEDRKIMLSDIFPNTVGSGKRNRKINGEYVLFQTQRKDGKSNCITATCKPACMFLDENGLRDLTPEEAEILQGFPEGYTTLDKISKTKRFKLIGNSWSIPTIEYIFSFMEF